MIFRTLDPFPFGPLIVAMQLHQRKIILLLRIYRMFLECIQDSGQGFNSDYLFSRLEENEEAFGRGINLVKGLCQSVEYMGNGNRVQAVYEWDN